MNRVLRFFVSCGLCLVAGTAFVTAANAQARRAAPAAAPATAKAAAPIDLTGHWVSLITDDWVYRMITPARGDVSYVPLNPEGRRVAEAWDPARDEAAGEQCKGYSAPAIMRLPSHVEITWQDDNTLKLDIDTGMQTRLFHFGQTEAQGARSWQGWSAASWQLSGTTEQFYPGPTSLGQIKRAGSLKVDTTNLRAGYLRKNGVPFSENAFMTEYYNLIVEDDGNQYLVIQTFVADPRYLTAHFVRTMQFKREPDGSKRNPMPCSAT
ncbi:MAG TPA: hypothetical protein VNA66_06045 [Gammaproteobacteria bacterium]|jgi:hypothetical protein|nr:hypothetical protein [Gammaproteobacteria bacterium]